MTDPHGVLSFVRKQTLHKKIVYRNDVGLTFSTARLEERIDTESVPSCLQHKCADQKAVLFHALDLRSAIKESPWRMSGVFCSYCRSERYSLVRGSLRSRLTQAPYRRPAGVGRLCETAGALVPVV